MARGFFAFTVVAAFICVVILFATWTKSNETPAERAETSPPPVAPHIMSGVVDPSHPTLNAEFKIQASPAFTVTSATNIPTGTALGLIVEKPKAPDAPERLAQGLPACDPNCFPFEADGVVNDGRVVFQPFKGREAELQPGEYTMSIVFKMEEPDNVRSVIGDAGQYLTGSLVKHHVAPNGEVVMTTMSSEIGYRDSGQIVP